MAGSGRSIAMTFGWAARWLLPCAALALLTTVLFAWAVASLGDPYLITEHADFVEHYDPRSGGAWMQLDSFGARDFDLFAPRRGPVETKEYFADVPGVAPAEPPAFAAVPGKGDDVAMTALRGWPALCLYHNIMGPKTGMATTRLLVETTLRGERLRLPLGVYWPGMIADVALYTALFGTVRFTVSTAMWRRRASLRRTRGQCPSCGYDRHGLVTDMACPECGSQP